MPEISTGHPTKHPHRTGGIPEEFGVMKMNAIVRHESHEMMTKEDMREILRNSLYPGASDGSIDMVLGYCQAAGLDVMQKPVHIVPMWDSKSGRMRDVVMPGIGMYRVQASRSGECAGVSEPEFGPMIRQAIGGVDIEFPEFCRVTTRRLMKNGAIAEFTAIEYWQENYAVKGGKEKSIAPNSMWTKRPRGQIAKCAQAQSLRLAFPEIGAAPTAEEMEGKSFEGAAEVVAMERPKRTAYPAADFERNLSAWRDLIDRGKSTAEEIIAKVESKGSLTDLQKARIHDPMAGQVIEGEIVDSAQEDAA